MSEQENARTTQFTEKEALLWIGAVIASMILALMAMAWLWNTLGLHL